MSQKVLVVCCGSVLPTKFEHYWERVSLIPVHPLLYMECRECAYLYTWQMHVYMHP